MALLRMLFAIAVAVTWSISFTSGSNTVWAYGQSGGNERFAMMSASGNHVVAIRAKDKSVWTWGANDKGQLGYDTGEQDQTVPRKVDFPIDGLEAKSVAAGGNFTVALMTNGTIWAWGDNSVHQLGNRNDTLGSTYHPVQVKGDSAGTPLVLGTDVVQIAAGYDHAAVLLNGGWIKAWGGNAYGQLGINSAESPSSAYAVDVINNGGTGVSGFTSISLGNQFSVGLRTDGSVFTWGRNDLGQLGDGTTENKLFPNQVPYALLNGFITAISAGDNHVVTIMAETGSVRSVWGWGNNDAGQLGATTVTGATYSAEPLKMNKMTLVGGSTVKTPIEHASKIAAGGTLSMVIDETGVGFTGKTYFGPLVAVVTDPMASSLGVQEIVSGGESMYMLTADGRIFVAGKNDRGQLGSGRKPANESLIPIDHIFDVAADASELTWDTIKLGNISSETVTSNLKLPKTGASGTEISWASSNPGVVGIEGTVNRPAEGDEDVDVKLTATISKGSAVQTLEFNVLVLAKDESEGYLNAEWAFANVAGTKIRIRFDKPLDTGTELNPEHFVVMDGEVGVQSASYDDNDEERRTVILKLTAPVPDSAEITKVTVLEEAVWASDETTNQETVQPIILLKLLDLNHNGKFSIDDVVRLTTLDVSNLRLGSLEDEMPGEPGEEPEEPLDYDTLLMLLQLIEPLYSE